MITAVWKPPAKPSLVGFSNGGVCLCLVSAVLMEFSEDWEYGRTYLNMEKT